MTSSQRHRTTWNKPGDRTSREAATSRRADPYTMNQDHPQPSPTEYENGDPDSWAETPTDNQLIYDGYEGGEGGHEMRNEVNFVEFKPETFDHKDSKQWKGPGKYDNAKVSATMRKASAAERVARATLRTSNTALIEAQAIDLMSLPDKVLVATLQRLDSVSPDALPKDRKYKRALACCKFAADLLGDAGTQSYVEKIGRVLMSIDDPTLKEMFRLTAAARSAAEAEEEETEEIAVSSDMEEEEDDSMADPVAAGSEEGCLNPQDLAMLDSMLQQEMGQPGMAPAAPAPSGELADLFESPAAPAPGAFEAPMMAQAASNLDISFDSDDEDEMPRTASNNSDDGGLSSLFDDHPEVVAQREVHAALVDQRVREGGYGPVSDVRTASDGARKLGNVRNSKPTNVDDQLASIWDRPEA